MMRDGKKTHPSLEDVPADGISPPINCMETSARPVSRAAASTIQTGPHTWKGFTLQILNDVTKMGVFPYLRC
jgi:hypothetical protein